MIRLNHFIIKRPLRWLSPALMLVLLLAGCRGASPRATPTPTAPPPAVATAALSSANATAAVDPATGGTIALETGADITFPPQSLAALTTVTFRTADDAAPAPIPRSQIGAAYEVALAGELTGIALMRLPLPPGVSADSYELAPYRWNGAAWTRITGRVQEGYVQFGVNEPGRFAIQGQWRFADAATGLVKTEVSPGQDAVPLTVVGQYRFSALPALTGEFVPARLLLKQDTSGGAGRATGMTVLDASVEEAPLLFKPDPTTPRGLIEFNHVFNLRPDLLDLKPGNATRFYVVFEVQDSAAPTRRMSSGVEYTQILPLQIVGGAVVRPVLANETRYSLRWNVTRDGAPFYQEQATAAQLAIQPLIDRGGLGDYRVVLEVEQDGAWAPVSNEVTFQLALRPSATPEPGQEPVSTSVVAQVTSPTPGAPGVIPAPPTRRPTPAVRPGDVVATPTVAVAGPASVTPAASPTVVNGSAAFFADKLSVSAGECANLTWRVDNVLAVFLDNAPVTGSETRQVCPQRTTTYTLRVQTAAGFQDRTVTITVNGSAVGTPSATDIEFSADTYNVAPGGCAVLRWRAVNVNKVYLNNEGVAGEATRQVCLQVTTSFTLRVETTSGQTITRSLTIIVSEQSTDGLVRFWAEQYTLQENACTTLHWKVQNVRQVFLDERGVPGEGQADVCPAGPQMFYSLRVIDNAGDEIYREITLIIGDPGLSANEVIAQGVVGAITNQVDIDPTLPGEQNGYALNIEGLNPLFVGANGFSQSAVTLRVPEDAVSYGINGPVDWPIRSGQLVEFRATCQANACNIDLQTNAFLFLRSE